MSATTHRHSQTFAFAALWRMRLTLAVTPECHLCFCSTTFVLSLPCSGLHGINIATATEATGSARHRLDWTHGSRRLPAGFPPDQSTVGQLPQPEGSSSNRLSSNSCLSSSNRFSSNSCLSSSNRLSSNSCLSSSNRLSSNSVSERTRFRPARVRLILLLLLPCSTVAFAVARCLPGNLSVTSAAVL